MLLHKRWNKRLRMRKKSEQKKGRKNSATDKDRQERVKEGTAWENRETNKSKV